MKSKVYLTTLILIFVLAVTTASADTAQKMNTQSHAPMATLPGVNPTQPAQPAVQSSMATTAKTANWYSINWAGYAISGSPYSISDVKGTWNVPPVKAGIKNKNHYMGSWLGIDGFSSPTVEQTGTEGYIDDSGKAHYDAWVELYPAPPIVFKGFKVSPWDSITAEVKFTPINQPGGTPAGAPASGLIPAGSTISSTTTTDVKTLSASDIAAKIAAINTDSTTKGVAYDGTGSTTGIFTTTLINKDTNQIAVAISPVMTVDRSSAEWITEAPSSDTGILPLANFDQSQFGTANTGVTPNDKYILNGITGKIDNKQSGGVVNHIDMVSQSSTQNNIIFKAKTSMLDYDGASFIVKWVKDI